MFFRTRRHWGYRRRRRNRVPGAIIFVVVLLALIARNQFGLDLTGLGARLDELLSFPRLDQRQLGTIAGPVRVLDGDSLVVAGENIRLFGVDAPEGDQTCELPDGSAWRCGDAATEFMAGLIVDGRASCEVRDIDHYRRRVAICQSGGVDLNRSIVAAGFAVAYRRYSSLYVDAEATAREARRGIWATSFIEPELWRRRAATNKAQ